MSIKKRIGLFSFLNWSLWVLVPFWLFTQIISCRYAAEQTPPSITDSNNCDNQAKSEIAHLEKWIATFPEVQQKKIRSKLIEGIRFIPVEWKAYNKPDTSSLAVYYDSTITTLKSIQNEWIKALAVIRFVYENANQGDFEILYPEKNKVFMKLNARQQFMEFRQHSFGGGCEAYASFAVNLLNEVGLAATIIGFDTQDKNGYLGLHKAVLCVVNEKVILLDPMFPQYYSISKQDEPCDFMTLHQLISARKTKQIKSVTIPNNGGHYLGPLEKMICYPVNSPILGYSDVTAFYTVNDKYMLVDGKIENSFADADLFNARKLKLFEHNRLDSSYFSYFFFVAELEGENNYITLIKQKTKKLWRQ